MKNTIEYYVEQRDLALKQAESDPLDRAGWLRIAQEWQNLIDGFSAQPGETASDKPDQHFLD